MIRALLFDMGNVLLRFSHERMCRQIGELVRRPGDDVWRLLIDSGLFWRYESGVLTTAAMHRAIEQLFDCSVPRAELERAASDIFSRNESIEPLIDALAARGQCLVLVSNTCEAHVRWLDGRFPVLRHFTRRTLSYEVRACKPAPQMFAAACAMAGAAPAECFFTDDTSGHVEAARSFGIDAMVYRGADELGDALRARGLLP